MITIVGGLPEPVGGVTNFLYRFAIHFSGRVDKVLDLYPAENKWKVLGLDCIVRPRSKFLSYFWLVYQMLKCDSKVVYFNFSSPRSLLLFLFLPKRASVSWALTLHHGELDASVRETLFLCSRILKVLLWRVDRVGFIGEKQLEFFRKNGVCDNRLHSISTYLPYIDDFPAKSNFDSNLKVMLREFRGRFSKTAIASGYPTTLYRHDWVLSYFEGLSEDVGLIVCFYGADSEGLLERYKTWALKLPNVIVFESLLPGQFQQVLSSSDIYVRPTSTDSYGVAVAEALAHSLTVIASDACARASGAHTFDKNNRNKFNQLLDKAIKGTIGCKETKNENGLQSLKNFLGLL